MSALNELGFRLKPRARTGQKPPTVEHARAVVAQRDEIIKTGEEADAHGHRWIARYNETRSAVDALAEGRFDPDALPELRALASGYDEAAAQRRRGPEVRRQCEAQRFRLEIEEADAFSLWAEEYVKQYVAKRDALLPALREMMAAYVEAVSAWDSFRKARIEIAREWNSDVRRLNDDSHCPPPPLDSEVLEALISVLPRPTI